MGRRFGDAVWETELVHQKLFRVNRLPEVERFTVTYGYNLVTVNRAAERNHWVWRICAGVVITHPETTVRGRAYLSGRVVFGSGYHLSGTAFSAALGRGVKFGGVLFLAPEEKMTGTRALIPVSGGNASVPNAAVHMLLGVGIPVLSVDVVRQLVCLADEHEQPYAAHSTAEIPSV